MKKLTVAVIGCGDFARFFVPLFKAHPFVEKVLVCDLLPEKAVAYAKTFGVEPVPSFKEVLGDPAINAVAIFAQRHLHGPLVVQTLKAGKHVYSAVPMASEIEECHQIAELVKETGLTYYMGETCFYYPCAMFCREQYRTGTFGSFVYADAQYYHDISHFPSQFKADLASAGVPPFFYPTHSTAMVLSALDTYAEKVTAFGYVDQENDLYFKKGVNIWDNVFSNEYSLMKLHNGGTARINECRRIGWKAPSSTISGFYGTRGGYQFSGAQHLLTHLTETGVNIENVSDRVNLYELTEHKQDENLLQQVANHGYQWSGFSPMHPVEQLPEEFHDPKLPNGHMGSHQFLVNDFCTAAYQGKTPEINNAWLAARYTIPGLTAHQSALRDGEPLTVFDCGDPILK